MKGDLRVALLIIAKYNCTNINKDIILIKYLFYHLIKKDNDL